MPKACDWLNLEQAKDEHNLNGRRENHNKVAVFVC